MITFLKGNIVEISPTYVVLDCNGIGYFLNISLNTFTQFDKKKSDINMFYTYLSVKEDSHTLFGFLDIYLPNIVDIYINILLKNF